MRAIFHMLQKNSAYFQKSTYQALFIPKNLHICNIFSTFARFLLLGVICEYFNI